MVELLLQDAISLRQSFDFCCVILLAVRTQKEADPGSFGDQVSDRQRAEFGATKMVVNTETGNMDHRRQAMIKFLSIKGKVRDR